MTQEVKVRHLLRSGESAYLTDVRHLCVSGTNEGIGRKVAEYAKTAYGAALGRYERQEYGQMRQTYFRRNWPAMADRMKGVQRAFKSHLGTAGEADPDWFDYSALIYDVPPIGKPRRPGSSTSNPASSAIMPGCSAVYIPKECSASRHPIVARNYDAWRMNANVAFTCAPDDLGGQGQLYARPFVLELRPRRRRKIIALGGHDLLCPFQDAINDRGLYITSLADDAVPLEWDMTMAGGRNVGLGSRQLLLMLAESCSSVSDVKEAARALVVRKDIGLHWLIADAHGEATLLRIDRNHRVVFSDAPKDRPFLVTNHPVDQSGRRDALAAAHKIRKSHCEYVKPDADKHCTYPHCFNGSATGPCSVFGWDFAYDTFVRMSSLERRVAARGGKYSPNNATKLMDAVGCAFKSNDKAGIRRERDTRTIWSVTTELVPTDQALTVRYYVDDAGSVSLGSNQLKLKWAAYEFGFGFRSKLLWKDKPRVTRSG